LAAGRAEAVAISNAGQIAGSWSYEDDYLLYPAALYWGGAAAPATVIASAIPGAPTAVNSIGTVVGSDGSPSGTRAWLWRGRDIESLPHLGNVAPGSRAYDINDTGTAVGWSSRQDFRPRAVRWRDGAVEDLGTLPGHESSFAYAINNAGVVVGEARKFLGSSEAFLWTEKGGMTSLGSGAASDINDSGWVIGHVLDLFGTQSDPFLWRLSAGRRNLASLVDLAGTGFADLGRAEDINSAGEILGVALHRDGTLHSYVLTPVPEPAIWLFLALGGLIIAGKLRRRTASTGS
jgi:probable HAF family extracellular repeat protein